MAKTFTHIFLQALSYFFSNSHIITYFSGHSQKNSKHTFFSQSSHSLTKISKKASKKLPSFSCPNPDCPVGYRSFDTVKGYQNHLTHSAVRTEYASRQLSLQSLLGLPGVVSLTDSEGVQLPALFLSLGCLLSLLLQNFPPFA